MGTALAIDQPRGVAGIVYLIHLEHGLVPSHGSTHYIGWAHQNGLYDRIEAHATGDGSPLLRAANERGIRWAVARLWVGADRHFERRLKRRRKAKHLCPVCRQEVTFDQIRFGEAEITKEVA
jgi:predicted GIY-YIG superfamily endonuclease